ncbi:hypothetical protein [Bacillus sp. REN10]|uniref:hypothetical protein n=1 Tax=Bacillus sp. REN10 TaxID=2782541 RepID=UPI00193B8738|nr:hypothetical protein [Bacillus sp. REN10]
MSEKKKECRTCHYWEKRMGNLGRCDNGCNPRYILGAKDAFTHDQHLCEWYWPKQQQEATNE